jgi:hypothetical protein
LVRMLVIFSAPLEQLYGKGDSGATGNGGQLHACPTLSEGAGLTVSLMMIKHH